MLMRTDMTGNGLAIERLKPSDLSGGDIELWHELMLSHPAFCNAFLSPEFAIACEHVYRSVEVAVIHRGGTVCGFFPYQFVSSQKKILRLAERIGENMSDCAGIVADPQAGLNASDIFSLSGLNLIFLTHVYSSDPLLGPLASNLEDLHVIDLTTGKNAYLETLRKRKSFYQDTQRCRRKLSSEIGAVKFGYDSTPPLDAVQHVLDRKQAQYRASGAVAVFDRFERRALIAALNEVHSPYCAISVATLKAGDRDCAWHFGLICQGVMHYWFPVYEKSLGKYSPDAGSGSGRGSRRPRHHYHRPRRRRCTMETEPGKCDTEDRQGLLAQAIGPVPACASPCRP